MLPTGVLRRIFRKGQTGEFCRFALVGVVATAVHYVVYCLLQRAMAAGAAYSVGYVVSLTANFALTSLFTFRARATLKRGVGFGLAHLCNYLLQMGLLYVMLAAGVSREAAPLPVWCIAVPVNFLMVRFVFKHFGK